MLGMTVYVDKTRGDHKFRAVDHRVRLSWETGTHVGEGITGKGDIDVLPVDVTLGRFVPGDYPGGVFYQCRTRGAM